MNVNFSITKVLVSPGASDSANVVAKVFWAVAIERNGLESRGIGETLLDPPGGSPFVEYGQLTEQQLIDWVRAKEGGKTFIDMLTSIHEPILDRMEKERGLKEAVLPFAPAASASQSAAQQAVSEIYQGPKAVSGVIPTVIL
jgi:hypothetical protein